MSGLTGKLSPQDQKEQQLSSLKQSIDRYLADPTTAGLPEAIIAAVQVLLKPLSVSEDRKGIGSSILAGTLSYSNEVLRTDSLNQDYKARMLECFNQVATTGANTDKTVLSVATERGHFNLVGVLLNEVGATADVIRDLVDVLPLDQGTKVISACIGESYSVMRCRYGFSQHQGNMAPLQFQQFYTRKQNMELLAQVIEARLKNYELVSPIITHINQSVF